MMKFTATAHDNPQGSIRITIPIYLVKELGIKSGDAVRLAIIKQEPEE